MRSLRGGQLAVQMPANFDHPTHVLADEIGMDFGMEPLRRFEAVLAPDAYSLLLDELGFAGPHVRLQVYLHRLPTTASVIDWVSGSLLTRYRRDLGDRYDAFLDRYRRELLAALDDPGGAKLVCVRVQATPAVGSRQQRESTLEEGHRRADVVVRVRELVVAEHRTERGVPVARIAWSLAPPRAEIDIGRVVRGITR